MLPQPFDTLLYPSVYGSIANIKIFGDLCLCIAKEKSLHQRFPEIVGKFGHDFIN